MAIKYFCDVCSNEIEGPMSEASITEFVPLGSDQMVKLTVSAQMVNDKGYHISWDVCKHCIIDAVNVLDDRPNRRVNNELIRIQRLCVRQLLDSYDV